MKQKLITLFAMTALASFANAAVSFSSTALKNVQGTASGDLASGKLGLLIVDVDGDGFLNTIFGNGITSGNAISGDPAKLTKAEIGGLSVSDLFAGDKILARLSTNFTLGDASIAGTVTSQNISSMLSKNFAIVWFNNVASSVTSTASLANEYYGIARGADWVLPAADSGAFTFGTGTGATVFDQITLANGGSTSAATVASGGVSFATPGTSLQIVPETSTALLGAIGALGLLRRRRN
jgi:hypothetical protein